jgi:hypothetical protein
MSGSLFWGAEHSAGAKGAGAEHRCFGERPVPPRSPVLTAADALGNTPAEHQVTRPPTRGRGRADERVASNEAVAVKRRPLARHGVSPYPVDLPYLPQVERRPRRWLEQMLTSRLRLLLTASVLMLGAVVSPLGEGVALAHPTADFEWAPKPVVAGTRVTFVSTSTPFHDPYTPITRAEWTIDGAGTFTGNQVTVTAPAAGQWTVRLHVWDAIGEDGEVTKVINVVPPPQPPPQPPPPANQPPTPGLAVLPASPVVGEEVTLVSSSEDADGRISEHAWDLNGDGAFDQVGAVVTRRFATAGDLRVTLRVTDDKGASATVSRTLTVRQPLVPAFPGGSAPVVPAPPSRARLLSPFPVVRLVGSIASGQTIVRMLQVRAPAGALVLVRCRGTSCPVKRVKKVARKRRLRFAAFEQELLPGVVLEVFVRRGDRIGKYTRFAMRRNRFPKRTDSCLRPGTSQRIACPAR